MKGFICSIFVSLSWLINYLHFGCFFQGCCHWAGWQVSLTLCSTPWSLYKVHIEQEQDKKEKESRDKEAGKSVVDDGENVCLDDGSRCFCGTVLSCARNEPFFKQECLDYFSDLASLLSHLLQFCNWFVWQCLSTLHLSYLSVFWCLFERHMYSKEKM